MKESEGRLGTEVGKRMLSRTTASMPHTCATTLILIVASRIKETRKKQLLKAGWKLKSLQGSGGQYKYQRLPDVNQ